MIRRSLELTQEQWERLEQLAALTDSQPPTGPNVGGTSWRTLIKRIADKEFFVMNKYQITRTDVTLAKAQATLISGHSPTTDTVGETDSLKEAVEMAHKANQDRVGYSGARIVQGEKMIVLAVAIPLAYKSLQAFKSDFRSYNEADDSLTVSELNDRMDAYHYDVEHGM